jgi:general secretion pathway protein G
MKNTKGFTLIELLIVITIASLLTGVVVTSTTAARGKARDTRRQADIKEIQLGLALYYDVNKVYPTSGEGTAKLVAVGQKYLPSIPVDPQTGAQYEYVPMASNKHYCLGTKLEGTIPADNANAAGVVCTGGGGTTANYWAYR